MSLNKVQLFLLGGLLITSISTFYLFHYKMSYSLGGDATLDRLLTDAYYFSKASYCDIQAIQSWSCGEECSYHPSLTGIQSFFDKAKQAQGYCGYNQESQSIVVAFRGTDNAKNWISDFSAIPVKYEDCADCKIHLGFRDTLDAISEGITSCVVSLSKLYPVADIIVTGHSLGGALATLQAAKLKKFFPQTPQMKLITFGSPRVGNNQFSAYVNEIMGNNSFRVVNYHDIVPHVPPKGIGFLHIGIEVWLNDKNAPMEYKICDDQISGENPTCSSSVIAISFSTKDHLNYFGFYTGCTAELKGDNLIQYNQDDDGFTVPDSITNGLY